VLWAAALRIDAPVGIRSGRPYNGFEEWIESHGRCCELTVDYEENAVIDHFNRHGS
jgi:hypothetical protein